MRRVAIFLLLVVASGWMPRITGGLHWWLTASFFLSASTIDGGDHLAGVLTLILVPLALTDPRSWHWQEPPVVQESFGWQVRALLGWSSLIVVRIQMAGVYLHTFVAKTAVDEWADGTALYYWFTDHNFGLPPFLMFFVEPLLLNGATVVALTWGSIFVEILLFLGIAASERVRVWLLGLGLTFHGMIAVGIGLWSFSTTMFGGLILYLWSPARTFNLGRMVGGRWTKEGKAAVVRHGCRMRG